MAQPAYVGRFAPSPSGPLHFGSLVAALGSFLDARSRGGRWLLRIEDVDLPRSQAGAADAIRRALAACGLDWDSETPPQSRRDDAYRAALADLQRSGAAYPCACSRKEIAETASEGAIYPGTCRAGLAEGRAARAWRVDCRQQAIAFDDRIQGRLRQDLASEVGDFVVLRADGLFAYQLAVVVDDAEQGVNQVVRGADLLDSTPRQIHLQRLLGLATPAYAHLPVALDAAGNKLSKQTLAPALPDDARAALARALAFLGQQPPPGLAEARRDEILAWALAHWDISRVPRRPAAPQ